VIEPQRQALIPGFQEVRRAAMAAGALGCSISGAGPTMFAWVPSANASEVLDAMSREFARRSIEIDKWITEVQSAGARVVDP
jgi:homoserine kinase